MAKSADSRTRRHASYDRRASGDRRQGLQGTVASPGEEDGRPHPIDREAAAPSQEVGLGELGACLAAAIADVQRELARYPNPLGAYVLDELEVALPVATRIDELGQAMVTVVNPEAGQPAPAMVRFKLRPLLGAPSPPPPAASQPLSTLGLSPQAIAALQARRIFSVDDLHRVATTPAGAVALERLDLGVPVVRLVDRTRLFELPGVPTAVSAALAKAGIDSPQAFARAAPGKLAELLSRSLGQKIATDVVRQWQADTRDVTTIKLPPIRRPADVDARPQPR